MTKPPRPPQKKRHHYIPITYLSRFADGEGRVVAYKKDDPRRPLHLAPGNIAFERYYYSQPHPDGGQDNNRLEDLFSTVESEWPGVVDALNAARETEAHQLSLFSFLGLLRVRIPAARDPIERFLAHSVHKTAKLLQQQGKLPPPPKGLENLLDLIEISVDPHMSIHAMPSMMQGLSMIFEYIGFEVIHNNAADEFITSDNPVIYFDAGVSEAAVQPYNVSPQLGRIEFLFPLTPRLLLRGGSELPILRPGQRLSHRSVASGGEVRRMNRMTARFGYRFIFARQTGLESFIERYADTSPVVAFHDLGHGDSEFTAFRMVFATREAKPKWRK